MVQDYTPSIASLYEGHLLVFLDRHQTYLVGANNLACRLGDKTEPDVDALRRVGRSRIAQGVRFDLFVALSEPLDKERRA